MARNVEGRRARGDAASFWDWSPTPEELAAAQGVNPVANVDDLYGDFWPEDESVDDFMAFVRPCHCADNGDNRP